MPEVALPLFLLAIVIAGWDVGIRAVRAIVNRSLDMNVLMSSAVVGALAIGHPAEGAAVMVLFALSLFLESVSTRRTRRAVESLLELSPSTAAVKTPQGIETRQAANIPVGSTVIIRPGERVPLDGA